MKNVADRLKDIEFTEHIDDMQLALFRDQKLDESSKEEVFRHLAQCKRCREVLKVASEIAKEEQRLQPANNIDYKKAIILTIASSFLLTTFSLPTLQSFPDEVLFKGAMEEKSFLDKTIYYWQCRFDEIFEDDK